MSKGFHVDGRKFLRDMVAAATKLNKMTAIQASLPSFRFSEFQDLYAVINTFSLMSALLAEGTRLSIAYSASSDCTTDM